MLDDLRGASDRCQTKEASAGTDNQLLLETELPFIGEL
jgi:hypothetical protein